MRLISLFAIVLSLLPLYLAQPTNASAFLDSNDELHNTMDQDNLRNMFHYRDSGEQNNKKKCDKILPPVAMILGTSTGGVSIVHHNHVQTLLNDEECSWTPTYLAVTGKTCNEIVVGARAQLLSALNPTCAIPDIMCLVGLTYEEIKAYILEYHMPYSVVCHQDMRPQILLTSQGVTRSFYIEDILAQIYAYLKIVAEKRLCGKVRDVVITVPTTFSMAQKQLLKTACTSAGLTVLETVSEISAAARAAALAYGLNMHHKHAVIVKVVACCTEVAIFSVKHGNVVIKAQGGAKFGGNNIDLILVNYFVALFKSQYGKDPSGDFLAMKRLTSAAELVKITLGTRNEASIDIENFFGGITFSTVITRAKFESLNVDFFNNVMSLVTSIFTQSKVDIDSIDTVILFGRLSGIVKIQELLKHFFKCHDVNIYLNGAIEGLALIADSYNGNGGTSHHSRAYLDDLDDTKNIASSEIMFNDVTQQSFGIEVAGGKMDLLIEPNIPLPVKFKQTYTTTFDNQAEALIKIYEGKHKMTSANEFVAELNLKNLTPATKGKVQIDVTFEVDEKNVLSVTAAEKSTDNIIEKTYYEPEKRKVNVGFIQNNINTEEMAIEKSKTE